MLHPIRFLAPLGIVEAIQSADQVAGDPADALELDAPAHGSIAGSLCRRLAKNCHTYLNSPEL